MVSAIDQQNSLILSSLNGWSPSLAAPTPPDNQTAQSSSGSSTTPVTPTSAVNQEDSLLIGSLGGATPAYPGAAPASAQMTEEQDLLGGSPASSASSNASLIGAYEQSRVDLYA